MAIELLPMVVPGRRLLPLRSFLLAGVILALLTFVADLALYGPITNWAANLLVVQPVERRWGFHAEWHAYGTGRTALDLLTVVNVAPGGAFERAGIKPGFAFAPRKCGFGGPLFAGPYHEFTDGEKTVSVPMLPVPSPSAEPVVYRVLRPAG